MFKIILLILGVIFILANIKNICIIILQGLVTIAAFYIHPILGAFVGLAYILYWIGPKEKEEPKQEKQQSNQEQSQRQKEYEQYQEKEKQRREQRERQYQQNQREHEEYQRRKQSSNSTKSYFAGCTTKEQLKKRHRELCMKYHPDRGGNAEIFKAMQAEYESIKSRY